MQVGACLLLDAGPAFDLSVAQRLVAERVRAVPRLRQRLVRTPPGCGRPVWVDDPSFDISRHLRRTRCPPPGDERALLDLAADVITEPLPDPGHCGPRCSSPAWPTITAATPMTSRLSSASITYLLTASAAWPSSPAWLTACPCRHQGRSRGPPHPVSGLPPAHG